jgi:Na+/proline symporter
MEPWKGSEARAREGASGSTSTYHGKLERVYRPSIGGFTMIPTIGLMVCILGVVICAYVLARVIEISQREKVGSGARIVLWLVALLALGGAFGIAVLGMDLASAANRPSPRHEPPAEVTP